MTSTTAPYEIVAGVDPLAVFRTTYDAYASALATERHDYSTPEAWVAHLIWATAGSLRWRPVTFPRHLVHRDLVAAVRGITDLDPDDPADGSDAQLRAGLAVLHAAGALRPVPGLQLALWLWRTRVDAECGGWPIPFLPQIPAPDPAGPASDPTDVRGT